MHDNKTATKKLLVWAVLLLCLLWGSISSAAEIKASQAYVLAFTDFHGHLEEGAQDPGIAKFMGAVRAFTAAQPHTLLLAVGDLFTGTVESDLLRGKPTLKAMLSLKLAASAVGNHEFDWEKDDLARWSAAGLPFLSANIHDAQMRLPPGVEDGRIFLVGDMRVGVVGLTTTSTARTTKQANVKHLTFAPPVKALTPVAARLRKEGAEAIIVLAHLATKERPNWKEGIAPALREIAAVPGVTAVVYGHSHEEHMGMQGLVPIVQPAYRGRSLAILTLNRDDRGRVTASAQMDRLSERKQHLPVDKEGLTLLHTAQQDLGPAMRHVVAHAGHDLPHVDNRPSLLGQILCQALLEELPQGKKTVAILNDGGIRASLERGPITEKHLYQVIPFNNYIVRMEMTGAELASLLDFALTKEERSIQAGGITVGYNPTLPKGRRVTSMTLSDGSPVRADSTVTILVNDFLANGGDDFPFLQMGRRKLLLEVELRDVWRQWLQKQGTVRQALRPWVVTDQK